MPDNWNRLMRRLPAERRQDYTEARAALEGRYATSEEASEARERARARAKVRANARVAVRAQRIAKWTP